MLPKGYEIPETQSNYLRFKEGETRFRIMSDYIVGFEYWVEDEKGRRPVRVHEDDTISPDSLANVKNPPRHFWACVAYDYADQRIKILEITQKAIMRTLRGLEQDVDWGDPKGTKGYDLVVIRTGKTLQDTKYELRAKPKKELDEGIIQLYKDTKVNLNALFSGEDPFGEWVDPDDVVKAIG